MCRARRIPYATLFQTPSPATVIAALCDPQKRRMGWTAHAAHRSEADPGPAHDVSKPAVTRSGSPDSLPCSARPPRSLRSQGSSVQPPSASDRPHRRSSKVRRRARVGHDFVGIPRESSKTSASWSVAGTTRSSHVSEVGKQYVELFTTGTAPSRQVTIHSSPVIDRCAPQEGHSLGGGALFIATVSAAGPARSASPAYRQGSPARLIGRPHGPWEQPTPQPGGPRGAVEASFPHQERARRLARSGGLSSIVTSSGATLTSLAMTGGVEPQLEAVDGAAPALPRP